MYSLTRYVELHDVKLDTYMAVTLGLISDGIDRGAGDRDEGHERKMIVKGMMKRSKREVHLYQLYNRV